MGREGGREGAQEAQKERGGGGLDGFHRKHEKFCEERPHRDKLTCTPPSMLLDAIQRV